MARRAEKPKSTRAKRSRRKKTAATIGPRTKLTPKLQELLAECAYCGYSIRYACAQANIARNTYADWYERGKNSETKVHRRFYEAIEEAKARRYGDALATVHKAARGFEKISTKTRVVPGGNEDGTDQVLQVETTTEHVHDVRAAFRVLESMDPERWSPRLNAKIEQQPVKAYVDMPLEGEGAP